MKAQLTNTERYFPDLKCRTYGCNNIVFIGDFCQRCDEELEALARIPKPSEKRWGALVICFWSVVLQVFLAGAIWGVWKLAERL